MPVYDYWLCKIICWLQILNAEEELKRRICMQGNAIRPSVPLQVDASNDSGSMTRHFTPRMGSETNLNGDLEGQMFRMNSTSPSSESPIRRPAYIQHNVVMYSNLNALKPWKFLKAYCSWISWMFFDMLCTSLKLCWFICLLILLGF